MTTSSRDKIPATTQVPVLTDPQGVVSWAQELLNQYKQDYQRLVQAIKEAVTETTGVIMPANTKISLTRSFDGFLTVVDMTHHNSAVFEIRGTANATREVIDGSGLFSITPGNPNTINVFSQGGIYYVESQLAGSTQVAFHEQGGSLG